VRISRAHSRMNIGGVRGWGICRAYVEICRAHFLMNIEYRGIWDL
jgi:hypothetical protein